MNRPRPLDVPFDELARWEARAWFVDGMDAEDLVQEARIAAWKSTLTYDPTRGMTRRSYAALAIRMHMATVLKAAGREKRRALDGFVSLDEPASAHGTMLRSEILPDWRPEPCEQLAQAADLDAIVSGAGLSALEHHAILGLLDGQSYEQIGTPKSVDNALQRAKVKLRRAA